MNTTWTINNSASEFLRINGAHLLKNESINNKLLGLVDAMVKGQETFESPLFLTFSDGQENPSQAIRASEDRPLIITNMQEERVEALITLLVSKKVTLTGIIGPVDTASYFSEHWAKTKDVKPVVKMQLVFSS